MSSVFYMEIWYSGKVQGVGFRYKASKVAREFEICGMVKNLEDGRVYLDVEGSEAEVSGFKNELEAQMSHFIRQTETKSGMRAKKMTTFFIG